jgi:hypothetical protein
MERVRMGHVSLAIKENANTNVLIVRENILQKILHTGSRKKK